MRREELVEEIMKINENVNQIWMQSLVLNDEAEVRQEFADFESMENLAFDAFDYWLGDVEAEQKLNLSFAKFGSRNDGSSVAVWLQEDKDFSNSPIVLIGSEGDLDIIAPNYFMFILYTCLGYDMYQLLNFEKDGASPWKEKNQFALDSLQSQYQLSIPENIQSLIMMARAENQNVQEYIDSIKK